MERKPGSTARRIRMMCVLGGFLGAMPGGVLLLFGVFRVGIAVALLGAFIGAVLSLPGVSAGRTFRLFLAWVCIKNLPVNEDSLMRWVDSDDDEEEEQSEATTVDDVLVNWLAARHVRHRRGWLVVVGLVVGMAVGNWIISNGISFFRNEQHGARLPNPDDSFFENVVIVFFACGIWGAFIGGILASACYRRPLLFVAYLSATGSGIVGWAAGMENGIGLPAFTISVATFFVGFTLVLLPCFKPDE